MLNVKTSPISKKIRLIANLGYDAGNFAEYFVHVFAIFLRNVSLTLLK